MNSRLPLWGYLGASAISLAGTRLSMVAIPWLVLTTTGSATRTGLVAFAEMAPLVIAQALSGPWIDRLGARRVTVLLGLASALVVALIPALHLAGLLHFPVLLVVVMLAGSMRGPGEAAGHALVPDVVRAVGWPTERVTGLVGTVERLASMSGIALAGVLVALVGPVNALLVDAGSFLLAAVVLALTTRSLAKPASAEIEVPEARPSYAAELRSGWRYMRKDPVLMGIGVMVAMTNMLDQAYTTVLLPVWAHDSGNGVAAIGLLGSGFAAAALVGSLTATAVAERLPRFATYLLAFMIAGFPRYLMLAIDPALGWIFAVGLVAGFGSGFLNPILGAVLFERIPAPMMGRISSMNIAMSWSLMPLGGLLGGAAVAGLGLAPALLVFGGGYFLVTLLPAVRRRWRELDDRQPLTDRGAAP